MARKTRHKDSLLALRRIEGQVKGIQRMIDKNEYCVDIVVQIHAVIHALYRVGEKIFIKHIETCVIDALKGRSQKEKMQKINEVMDVIKRLNRLR